MSTEYSPDEEATISRSVELLGRAGRRGHRELNGEKLGDVDPPRDLRTVARGLSWLAVHSVSIPDKGRAIRALESLALQSGLPAEGTELVIGQFLVDRESLLVSVHGAEGAASPDIGR